MGWIMSSRASECDLGVSEICGLERALTGFYNMEHVPHAGSSDYL